MGIWASLIPAGASLLSNIVGGETDRKAQKRENRAQREFDEKMWHMNNEYNTPLNQRKRYEDAGYNPVASGQLPNPVASNVPNITPIKEGAVGLGQRYANAFGDSMTQFMNMRTQEENLRLMQARTDKEKTSVIQIGAQTAKALADTARTETERELAKKRLNYYDEQAQLEIDNQKLKNVAQSLYNQDIPNKIKRDAERHVQDIANSKAMNDLRAMQKSGIWQSMTESQKRIEAMKYLNALRQQQFQLNAMQINENEKHGGMNPLRKDPWTRTILNITRGLGLDDVADILEK